MLGSRLARRIVLPLLLLIAVLFGLLAIAGVRQADRRVEEELEQERQVVLREGDQRKDNPDSFLSRQFYQTFYDEHPYGRPVLGEPETVGAVTRETFLGFLDQYYVPNNMTVIVAGDIDPESTLAAVQAAFGDMEARELPAENYPAEQAEGFDRRR